MDRNWKGERAWWLDHFYLWSPGQQRTSKEPVLIQSDYVAIPLPYNVPTPLAWPCLIWRWALDGNGYGNFRGRGAHVLACERSRGTEVSTDMNILHLCHRPFCVQPAHLYQGTAKQNAEDRKALNSEMGNYPTWAMISDRQQKAMLEYYWPPPFVDGFFQRMNPDQRLECPHCFTRAAGDSLLCANCGETNSQSLFNGHRSQCHMPGSGPLHRPCRCLNDPCCCNSCLAFLIGPAQRAHEKAGGYIEGPLYEYIPKLVNGEEQSVPRAEARAIRTYLETMALASYPLLYTG